MRVEPLQILIADDHAMIRVGLRHALGAEMAAEFTEASNTREALALAHTQRFDLILLDITMPGRSGLDIIADLKLAQPEARILVVSMHGEEQYARRVLRAGASGYVTKSQLPAELLCAIQKVLAGRIYVSDAFGEQLAASINSGPRGSGHEALSAREFEVLRMIAVGKSGKEIAAELSISYKTVSTYRTRVLEKLNLRTNWELAEYVRRERLGESSALDA